MEQDLNDKKNLIELINVLEKPNKSELKHKELLSKQKKSADNYFVLKNGLIAEMDHSKKNKSIVKE